MDNSTKQRLTCISILQHVRLFHPPPSPFVLLLTAIAFEHTNGSSMRAFVPFWRQVIYSTLQTQFSNLCLQALFHNVPPPAPQLSSVESYIRRAWKSTTCTRTTKRWSFCITGRFGILLLFHYRRPAPLSLFLPGLGSAQYRNGVQSMYPDTRTPRGMPRFSNTHLPHATHVNAYPYCCPR